MKRFKLSLVQALAILASLSTTSTAQQPLNAKDLLPGNGPAVASQQVQPTRAPTANTANGQPLSAATTGTNPQATIQTTAQPLNGEEIAWLRSATEAAIQSQSTGKPILVYVRSQNCYYCDLLQKNTWQDPATRTRVMREMIPLKLTLEENKEAIEAMKVKGFPAVIVFSPRREYLGRIDGYVTPEQFQSQVSKVMLAYQPTDSAPVKR